MLTLFLLRRSVSLCVCVLVVVTADKAFRHSVSHLNQVVGNIVLHVCVRVCDCYGEACERHLRENAYMQLMRGSPHSFY